MAKDSKSRGLGRGLSALLGDENADYQSLDRVRAAKSTAIENLIPNKLQPRNYFDSDKIDDLANSIREHGILQPILVRRLPDSPDQYEIIAGERRWRAAQRAQLHEIPIVIRDFNDAEVLEAAIVENVQRENLNPIEEAKGYDRLAREFSKTQDQVAQLVGKSRVHVTNMLRLLNLPDKVQQMVSDGALSAGHARALITASDPVAIAELVIKQGLNVRDTEALAKRGVEGTRSVLPRTKPRKDADTRSLEEGLSASLGLAVAIDFRGDRGGSVKINYKTLEQLDDICQRLSHVTPQK